MAAIDINRATDGLVLPSTLSSEIWKNTNEASIIQRLVPGMQIPGGGVDIPVITGDPEAEWTAETEEKKVSRPKFANKNLKGHTLAVIVPFSNQFKRDLPTLYSAIAESLPGALAKKFDRTVLGFDASPGTGFDTLASASEVTLDGSMEPYLSALGAVAVADGDITGWALSSAAEIDALSTAGTDGKPLLVPGYAESGAVGRILARDVYKSKNVADGNVAGFAGDWGSARWGYVEGIKIDISDQATLTDGAQVINLWQRNMFALRAEVEIGFVARDPKRFVKINKPTAPAA